jgi:hypothetical protein
MFQMVRWSSCEKGHDLHSSTHSGLNAGTCVLENKAFSHGHYSRRTSVDIASTRGQLVSSAKCAAKV